MTPDPLAARVHALIAQWRKEATEWQHGIGDNQNTRTLTEHADALEAALAAALAPNSEKE